MITDFYFPNIFELVYYRRALSNSLVERMETTELAEKICKDVIAHEGLPWLSDYTDFGSFRPGNPPKAEVRILEVGPWLSVVINISYKGTTMDQTTDRLSGDPYTGLLRYDWIGPLDTAPKCVSHPSELDEWAVYKSSYVREYTDVGIWGVQQGSFVAGLEENGTVTIREGSGRFEDIDPIDLTTEKTIQLEIP